MWSRAPASPHIAVTSADLERMLDLLVHNPELRRESRQPGTRTDPWPVSVARNRPLYRNSLFQRSGLDAE